MSEMSDMSDISDVSDMSDMSGMSDMSMDMNLECLFRAMFLSCPDQLTQAENA